MNAAYLLTLLLASLWLGSCVVADPPYEPRVPERIRVDSPELVAPTHAAMDRWTSATGVQWRIVEGSADLVVRVAGLEEGVAGRYYSSGEIRIDPRVHDLEATLVHELGHALTPALVMVAGEAAHHDDPGIMHSAGGPCINDADLALVCSEYACAEYSPEC